MTNVVTLDLTGDASSLDDAISRATQQVKNFDTTTAAAATSIETSGTKMDRLGERADQLATRTGTLAGGIGALAGGMALLGVESDSAAAKVVGGLSVAIGTLSGVMDIVAIATQSKTVALVASKVAMGASAVATGVMTAAQWALNIAMSANPIGLIIAGVMLLIGVIVLIATKTTWFQTAWKWAWEGIKVAAGAVKDFFVNVVWEGGIKKAFDFIGKGIANVKDWFTSIPGKIGSAFSSIFGFITAPFRAAFNFVADAWNNTIGKLSWTVPNWVPFIGGNTISAPRLPKFHEGGDVRGPGAMGTEVLAVLQVGERVQTRAQVEAADRNNGGTTVYHITVQGSKFRDGTDFEEWVEGLRHDGRGGEDVTE